MLIFTWGMLTEQWTDFIEQKLHQRPLMQAQDAYKPLYQGVLGSEHLLRDREKSTVCLKAELADLTADPEEELLEPVRADGRLCRINLRAWLAQGRALDELIAACFNTAGQPWGTQTELVSIWEFCSSVHPEFRALTQELMAQGYPPVHHSATYTAAYHPAYRLVMR